MTALPSLVVFDEFGHYAREREGLKKKLLDIDGIPKSTFAVQRDGRIFVFGKLLQLVSHSIGANAAPDKDIRSIAKDLLPQAIISPSEAILEYGIVPVPYRINYGDPVANIGERCLVHAPFQARIPEIFPDAGSMCPAMSAILLGGFWNEELPHSSERNQGFAGQKFNYRGQDLILWHPLGLEHLPTKPEIPEIPSASRVNVSDGGELELGFMIDPQPELDRTVEFRSGYPPVERAFFDKIRGIENDWLSETSGAIRTMLVNDGREDALAQKLTEFPEILGQLNAEFSEGGDFGHDDEAEELCELRKSYPDLSALSDGAIYALYDQYQSTDRLVSRNWPTERDVRFYAYLAGCLSTRVAHAGINIPGDDRSFVSIGRWATYAILCGMDLDSAMAFGWAVNHFDATLRQQTSTIRSAMLHLASLAAEPASELMVGTPVMTLNDILSIGRKSNI
ncbi:hypothetical protein [Acetobacter persici]|uniref:Uncharacterized protein n=1 Tax=Acetobacter persici TaxID=1076596 RepID=A0A1U9LJS5_9PROT|nr:hypothetical protein [Acetobacter persici]AQT06696.1 hypothetical protein A0U91_16980 [Acetobacter persici]